MIEAAALVLAGLAAIVLLSVFLLFRRDAFIGDFHKHLGELPYDEEVLPEHSLWRLEVDLAAFGRIGRRINRYVITHCVAYSPLHGCEIDDVEYPLLAEVVNSANERYKWRLDYGGSPVPPPRIAD